MLFATISLSSMSIHRCSIYTNLKAFPLSSPVCSGAPAAAALFSFHRSDGVITLNWWRDGPSETPFLSRTLLIPSDDCERGA